jgi:hypothetical protein
MGQEPHVPIRLTRPRYGAGPLHLLAHVIAFAIAGYAVAQIVRRGSEVNFVAWFAGAALLHDLVLLPLYSVLDHFARRGRPAPRPRRGAINYIRVPAAISGLLLLVYFPLIVGLSDRNYFAASGHHLHGYALRWLLISAALFAGSAVVYALRARRQ